MPADVLEELIMFAALLPLVHQSFRLPIDDVVIATDASMKGGAVVVMDGLTSLGLQVASSMQMPAWSASSEQLLLVTFGDMLGGARRTLELLGATPAAVLALVDASGAARITRRSFPEATVLCSQPGPQFATLSPGSLVSWLEEMRLALPRVNHVLFFFEQADELAATVEWVCNSLAAVAWDVIAHAVIHAWTLPELEGPEPEPRDPPLVLWDAEDVSLLKRMRWVAVSEPLLAPWPEFAWRDSRQLLHVAATAADWFQPYWLDADSSWEHEAGSFYGPISPTRSMSKCSQEQLERTAEKHLVWDSEGQKQRWLADRGRDHQIGRAHV